MLLRSLRDRNTCGRSRVGVRHRALLDAAGAPALELPNFDTIACENWNQNAVPFRVIADIRRTRDSCDDPRPLAIGKSIHTRIRPTGHVDVVMHDLDAIKLSRTAAQGRRGIAARLPA